MVAKDQTPGTSGLLETIFMLYIFDNYVIQNTTTLWMDVAHGDLTHHMMYV